MQYQSQKLNDYYFLIITNCENVLNQTIITKIVVLN